MPAGRNRQVSSSWSVLLFLVWETWFPQPGANLTRPAPDRVWTRPGPTAWLRGLGIVVGMPVFSVETGSAVQPGGSVERCGRRSGKLLARGVELPHHRFHAV